MKYARVHGTYDEYHVCYAGDLMKEMKAMVDSCKKHGIACHVNLYNMDSQAIDPALRTDPVYSFVTISLDERESAGHSSHALLLEHLRCLGYMAQTQYT